MDRLYLDRSGHLWYAILNENGQSSNQRLFSDNSEEKRFLDFLGDSPTNYSLQFLQQLYGEYKRTLGQEKR
jgi:hypothetical protein